VGEIPHLKALVQRHEKAGFSVLGVNTDSDLAKAKARCAESGISWANLYDGKTKEICNAWGVSGFPTAFLMDRQGVIRKTFLGIDPKELDAAVEALMNEK
jgi:peroxiredoxin